MCANAAEMPTLKSPRTAAHAHIQALNEIKNKLNHIKQNNTRINISKSE